MAEWYKTDNQLTYKRRKNMNKKTAEILLIISTVFFLSVLILLAEPLRKVMNKMDNKASKQFVSLLFRIGTRSPFLLIVTNLTALLMIPYFIIYGFGNWWFIAALAVFIIGGCVAKAIKVPVYKNIEILDVDNPKMMEQLQKMHKGNIFQAILTFISVCMMTIGLFY
jgi:hypothetical protein